MQRVESGREELAAGARDAQVLENKLRIKGRKVTMSTLLINHVLIDSVDSNSSGFQWLSAGHLLSKLFWDLGPTLKKNGLETFQYFSIQSSSS